MDRRAIHPKANKPVSGPGGAPQWRQRRPAPFTLDCHYRIL